MAQLRVLLSAYACEPTKSSEPGVGWQTARGVAKWHHVWVLTRSNNRPVIERELAERPIPGLHFAYYDLPRWLRAWKRGGRGVRLYYYLWQIGAYARGRRLHSEFKFDVVHHVTFAQYWTPSFLSLLPVPFIWGPVGGGETAPRSFWRSLGVRGFTAEVMRDLARWLGTRDPFVRRAAKRSAVTLASTEETAARLRELGASNVRVLSQLGLSQDEIARLSQAPAPAPTPIRLISIGRLLAWKGFHLALRAFARLELESAEYWILGEGPERRRLELLANRLRIADRVAFWGRLTRDESLDRLASAHILVHPALHESGGFVCLEAMCAGKPVICLDIGGPANQVTSETGVKILASNPEQCIRGIADAMSQLAADANLRRRMGEAGRRRVQQRYHWDQKGELLSSLYFQAVGRSPTPTGHTDRARGG